MFYLCVFLWSGYSLNRFRFCLNMECLCQHPANQHSSDGCRRFVTESFSALNSLDWGTACVTLKYAVLRMTLTTPHLLRTGERPFHCTLCEKAFNQKSALQVHMKKHTGERPYRCDYCVMGFTQKSNMKLHMKRAHSFVGKKAKSLGVSHVTFTHFTVAVHHSYCKDCSL